VGASAAGASATGASDCGSSTAGAAGVALLAQADNNKVAINTKLTIKTFLLITFSPKFDFLYLINGSFGNYRMDDTNSHGSEP
jgi:hypothetical protein